MRKAAFICIVTVLAILTGCREDRQFRALLDEVDNLMNTRPDSALALLQVRADSIGQLPESQRMRYHLLTAKAQNKAYVDFTTDSLMLLVTEYYDHHGTPNDRMMAHYLLGCCYRDMGEAPATIECYKDAVNQADTTQSDCDFRTLMSIYGQMATLYDQQVMPTEELEALERSGWYALKCGDTLNYIRSIEYKIKAFRLYEDTMMIINTIERTRNLYLKYGYIEEAAKALPAAIQIQLKRKDFENAHEMMQIYETQSGLFDTLGNIQSRFSHYYKSKGLYYLGTNRLDSAEFFFKRLLKDGYKLDAYLGLVEVNRANSQHDSAISYVYQLRDAYKEEFAKLNTTSIRQTAAMYDYTRNREQAYEGKLEAERIKHIVFILSMLMFASSLLFIYLFRRHRNLKQKELEETRRAFKSTQEQYENNLRELNILEESHKKIISTLQEQLQDSLERAENQTIKSNAIRVKLEEEESRFLQETSLLKEEIKRLNDRVVYFNKQTTLSEDFSRSGALLRSQIVRECYVMAAHPQIKMSAHFWDELTKEFSTYYPELIHDILRNPNISIQGQHCILASLLHVRSSEIAHLLGATPQRVSNLRSELNKTLFNDNSARTLVKNMEEKYAVYFSQEELNKAMISK